MNKLTRADLLTLEAYDDSRDRMRADIIVHKERRRLSLGPICNLHFEDRQTMLYQVQEMLRAERIFAANAIQEELDAYNPLIPDGANWKATMMLEIPDPAKRAAELARLLDVEDRCYMEVDGFDRVYAIADEDLERDTPEKTSSVHFLRFELDADMIGALRDGAGLAAGVDHEFYGHRLETVPEPVRQALLADLD